MNRSKTEGETGTVEKTLLDVLDIIEEGVWDWNARTGEVRRNAGWYRMLGYETHSMDADVLTWEKIIHPEDYQRVMAHFEAYINGETERYRIEYRCRCRNGRYRWIRDSGRIVERSPKGEVLRMIGAHLDIDDAKRAKAVLERQNALLRHDRATLENLVRERTAELDALNRLLSEQLENVRHIARFDRVTSVYNRCMFEELLRKEISRAKRYRRPMSLIMVDVDYFKQINDVHGHYTGDAVLAGVAGTLSYSVRASDIVARWGGDEFVIILPDTRREEALSIAETLRQRVTAVVFEKGIELTCSFGVTEYRSGDDLTSVFARIDAALYRAKESERNNVKCG